MAGGAVERNLMTFDEVWPILQEQAINKLIANLEIEGLPDNKYFTAEEHMRFYTLVYNVATSIARPFQQDKLYDQYKRTFEDYFSSKVLPSLRGKENENLLRELLRRWNHQKTMSKWLSNFFSYLSRYYIYRHGEPSSLEETGRFKFCNLVFGEIKDQISGAIVSLVDREREGEQIDQAVVKQVMDIFEEFAKELLQKYAKNIELALLRVDRPYLPGTSLGWKAQLCKSYEDAVDKCFEMEKTSVSKYFRLTNQEKVLEVYGEIKDRICGAISSLVDREFDGEPVASALKKQVRDIFEEISKDALKIYAKDIEEALVESTARFYSKKAVDWIATKSYEDYMLKVEECLEKENRVSEYLKLMEQNKIMEVVQHELLNVHADKLQEKKASSRSRRSKL